MKKRKSGISITMGFVSLLLLTFLAACMAPNEEFIQGIWYYDNLKALTDPTSYHVPYEDWEEFVFEGGNYRYTSCCNRRISDAGQYYVVSSMGNEIVLDLVGETGVEFTDGMEIKIIVDVENERISFFRYEWERIYP